MSGAVIAAVAAYLAAGVVALVVLAALFWRVHRRRPTAKSAALAVVAWPVYIAALLCGGFQGWREARRRHAGYEV